MYFLVFQNGFFFSEFQKFFFSRVFVSHFSLAMGFFSEVFSSRKVFFSLFANGFNVLQWVLLILFKGVFFVFSKVYFCVFSNVFSRGV